MDRAQIRSGTAGPEKINLGCGEKYLEGYRNCDVLPHVRADQHFDLEEFPWPLDDHSADEVLMDNVLEHLEDVPRVMAEVYRVLRPGGLAHIWVPYGKSDWALQDPTHRHFFTETSMAYFCTDHPYNYYTTFRFRQRQAILFTDSSSWRHRLRNAIPLRNILRFFLTNMYDGIFFELEKC